MEELTLVCSNCETLKAKLAQTEKSLKNKISAIILLKEIICTRDQKLKEISLPKFLEFTKSTSDQLRANDELRKKLSLSTSTTTQILKEQQKYVEDIKELKTLNSDLETRVNGLLLCNKQLQIHREEYELLKKEQDLPTKNSVSKKKKQYKVKEKKIKKCHVGTQVEESLSGIHLKSNLVKRDVGIQTLLKECNPDKSSGGQSNHKKKDVGLQVILEECNPDKSSGGQSNHKKKDVGLQVIFQECNPDKSSGGQSNHKKKEVGLQVILEESTQDKFCTQVDLRSNDDQMQSISEDLGDLDTKNSKGKHELGSTDCAYKLQSYPFSKDSRTQNPTLCASRSLPIKPLTNVNHILPKNSTVYSEHYLCETLQKMSFGTTSESNSKYNTKVTDKFGSSQPIFCNPLQHDCGTKTSRVFRDMFHSKFNVFQQNNIAKIPSSASGQNKINLESFIPFKNQFFNSFNRGDYRDQLDRNLNDPKCKSEPVNHLKRTIKNDNSEPKYEITITYKIFDGQSYKQEMKITLDDPYCALIKLKDACINITSFRQFLDNFNNICNEINSAPCFNKKNKTVCTSFMTVKRLSSDNIPTVFNNNGSPELFNYSDKCSFEGLARLSKLAAPTDQCKSEKLIFFDAQMPDILPTHTRKNFLKPAKLQHVMTISNVIPDANRLFSKNAYCSPCYQPNNVNLSTSEKSNKQHLQSQASSYLANNSPQKFSAIASPKKEINKSVDKLHFTTTSYLCNPELNANTSLVLQPPSKPAILLKRKCSDVKTKIDNVITKKRKTIEIIQVNSSVNKKDNITPANKKEKNASPANENVNYYLPANENIADTNETSLKTANLTTTARNEFDDSCNDEINEILEEIRTEYKAVRLISPLGNLYENTTNLEMTEEMKSNTSDVSMPVLEQLSASSTQQEDGVKFNDNLIPIESSFPPINGDKDVIEENNVYTLFFDGDHNSFGKDDLTDNERNDNLSGTENLMITSTAMEGKYTNELNNEILTLHQTYFTTYNSFVANDNSLENVTIVTNPVELNEIEKEGKCANELNKDSLTSPQISIPTLNSFDDNGNSLENDKMSAKSDESNHIKQAFGFYLNRSDEEDSDNNSNTENIDKNSNPENIDTNFNPESKIVEDINKVADSELFQVLMPKKTKIISEKDTVPCIDNAFSCVLKYMCDEVISGTKKPKNKQKDINTKDLQQFQEFFENYVKSNDGLNIDTINELQGFCNDQIARFLLDKLVDDKEEIGEKKFYPHFTILQRKVLILTISLSNENNNFCNTILTSAEEVLVTFSGAPVVISNLVKLGQFHTLLCKSQGLINRSRCLLYDVLYTRKLIAYPIAFKIISIWPQVLPLAKYMKGCVLTYTISYLLAKVPTQWNIKEHLLNTFAIIPLRKLIQNHYGYKQENVAVEQLGLTILKYINYEGCEKAFILLAKCQGPNWAMKTIEKHMFPVLHNWLEGHNEDEDYVAEIVSVIGKVSRGLPLLDASYFTVTIFEMFEKMLTKSQSFIITEALVESICLLRKHNLIASAKILLKWWPKERKLTNASINNIKTVLCVKDVNFWTDFIKKY